MRLAAVLAVALGTTACSSVPDWVDPTSWVDDTPTAQTSDTGQTPDLADLPSKPATPTSDADKQVSDSLAADRADANYSTEQLRANASGTEATAAPPPAPAPESQPAQPADTAAPAPQPQNDTPPPNKNSSLAQPMDNTASAAPEPQTVAMADPTPAAASSPPPGAEPAVPVSAAPTPRARMAAETGSVSPSDAALGFKPSSAPPLDPSVSQFVAAPIIAHYEETASIAGTAAASGAPVVAVDPAASDPPVRHRHSRAAMGGPEKMSGAVVANLDAIQSPAAAVPAAYSTPTGSPAAVVLFPGDGTLLNVEARAKVREAADAFRATGGQGFVRVVGHASSRTANMPVEKHLELIFAKSQQRADAVRRELIRDGIPAEKVLEEAVGDSQPIYYESMPKGEDGNRRAEIFLQS